MFAAERFQLGAVGGSRRFSELPRDLLRPRECLAKAGIRRLGRAQGRRSGL